MQEKKKSRRSSVKYPGLDKSVNRRVIREYIDYDYIDKLSAEEKQWLSNFSDEFLSANFKHKKGKILNRTKKSKQEIYNRNNARNRDVTSILKQRGHITSPNNLVKVSDNSQGQKSNNQEDVVIAIIDIQDEKNAKIKAKRARDE